jgi:hypothetical protein
MSAADGQLIAFMAGSGPDDRGRTFHDILAFSFDELEDVHDYIQWLFPLYARSEVNPSAPVLDRVSVAALRRDPALRRQLRRAFEMMLRFYGLEMTVKGNAVRVARSDEFRERQAIWLNRGNHNFLRLTRILRCLSILHAAALSRALLVCLLDIATEHPGVISERTIGYWRDAVPPG